MFCKQEIDTGYLRDIDKYALTTLSDISKQVMHSYQSFEFASGCKILMEYMQNNLRNFYLDINKSVLYFDKPDSKARKALQVALFIICDSLMRLWAPVLCFFAEQLFYELKAIHPAAYPNSTSVHLLSIESPFVSEAVCCCPSAMDKQRWLSLERLRKLVLAEIEKRRKNGQLKKNEHAAVRISLPQRALQEDNNNKKKNNREGAGGSEDCRNIHWLLSGTSPSLSSSSSSSTSTTTTADPQSLGESLQLLNEQAAEQQQQQRQQLSTDSRRLSCRSSKFLCDYFVVSHCEIEFLDDESYERELARSGIPTTTTTMKQQKKQQTKKKKEKKGEEEEEEAGSVVVVPLKDLALISVDHAQDTLCYRCDRYFDASGASALGSSSSSSSSSKSTTTTTTTTTTTCSGPLVLSLESKEDESSSTSKTEEEVEEEEEGDKRRRQQSHLCAGCQEQLS